MSLALLAMSYSALHFSMTVLPGILDHQAATRLQFACLSHKVACLSHKVAVCMFIYLFLGKYETRSPGPQSSVHAGQGA